VGRLCSRGSHPQWPPTVKRTHQGGRRVTSRSRRAAFDTRQSGENRITHTARSCSVENGDALHLSVEPVDEHLARFVLTGDHDGVVDRVVELRVGAEVFSTSIPRLGAVFLFDYVEEGLVTLPTVVAASRTAQGQRSRPCRRGSVFAPELAWLVLRNRDGS
jgi:hypothetical protein